MNRDLHNKSLEALLEAYYDAHARLCYLIKQDSAKRMAEAYVASLGAQARALTAKLSGHRRAMDKCSNAIKAYERHLSHDAVEREKWVCELNKLLTTIAPTVKCHQELDQTRQNFAHVIEGGHLDQSEDYVDELKQKVLSKGGEVTALQNRVVELESILSEIPKCIEAGWEEELQKAYDTHSLPPLMAEYQRLDALRQEKGHHVVRHQVAATLQGIYYHPLQSSVVMSPRHSSPTTSRTYRNKDIENPIYRIVDELSIEVASLRDRVQAGNTALGEVKTSLYEEKRRLKRSSEAWKAHLERTMAELEVTQRSTAKIVKKNQLLKQEIKQALGKEIDVSVGTEGNTIDQSALGRGAD